VLGVQTFVLSSVLLFLVYALLVYRWLRRTIPIPAALLLLTIIVLHPLNAEIVQWPSPATTCWWGSSPSPESSSSGG